MLLSRFVKFFLLPCVTTPPTVTSQLKSKNLLKKKKKLSQGLAGTLAGAGGGACQTIVMAPMTFLVTAAVTSQPGSDSG